MVSVNVLEKTWENTTNAYEENDIIDLNMNNLSDRLSETFQNVSLPAVETIVPVSYINTKIKINFFMLLLSGVFVQLDGDAGDNFCIFEVGIPSEIRSHVFISCCAYRCFQHAFIVQNLLPKPDIKVLVSPLSVHLIFRSFSFYDIPPELKMTLLLLLTVVLFHVLDRQMEFTSRTDFLWKAKLKVEQEEVETMRGINKILLENILPAHVADHFLSNHVSQVRIRFPNFLTSGTPFKLLPGVVVPPATTFLLFS